MFSMIYLWLIGAVVLAGADILLGTIYLLIIAAAALAAFIFALIGAGILFQLLLPANLADMGSMVASAMTIIREQNGKPAAAPAIPKVE